MFIARTRFSLFLPQSAAWLVTRGDKDIEEYKKNLFEETRLNFRVGFLSQITLPLLKNASKNEKFLHIIEYSDSLPKKYIKLLKDIELQYDFVRLICYNESGIPDNDISSIAFEHFSLKHLKEETWIGRFILDDDDCLSLNYFGIMKAYLQESFEGFYVSAGTGAVGSFDEEYNITLCSKIYEPKINIGFMNIGRYSPKDKKVIFNEKITRHSRMDELNRVILDSRQVAFFWSRHRLQDTRSNKSKRGVKLGIRNLETLPKLTKQEVTLHFGEGFYEKLCKFNEKGEFDYNNTKKLSEFKKEHTQINTEDEIFEFNPYEELGLSQEVRLIVASDANKEVILSEIIPPRTTFSTSFDKLRDVLDLKYKYQIMDIVNDKHKWVNIQKGYSFVANK